MDVCRALSTRIGCLKTNWLGNTSVYRVAAVKIYVSYGFLQSHQPASNNWLNSALVPQGIGGAPLGVGYS